MTEEENSACFERGGGICLNYSRMYRNSRLREGISIPVAFGSPSRTHQAAPGER